MRALPPGRLSLIGNLVAIGIPIIAAAAFVISRIDFIVWN